MVTSADLKKNFFLYTATFRGRRGMDIFSPEALNKYISLHISLSAVGFPTSPVARAILCAEWLRLGLLEPITWQG